jgi:hypothetical protein
LHSLHLLTCLRPPQVHGFPRVIGVLTHLDSFKEQPKLRATKKALKTRFWTEIYDGAKLFYLSGEGPCWGHAQAMLAWE